jgi:hypothetical protein
MRRALIVPAAFVVVFLISACSHGLNTLGPTPPDQGIVIYIHAQFAGPSQEMNADAPDLQQVEGPCSTGEEGARPTWSDCVSSVRVLPGWSATLYRDDDFRGNSVTVTADTPSLRQLPGPCDGSFNDCVSSIRVVRQ